METTGNHSSLATVVDGSPRRNGELQQLLRLFLLSVFLLYMEILLIRWISTEIRVFAYINNLPLIACFFGMGLGCMLTGRRWLRFWLTLPLLASLVAVVVAPKFFGLDVYTRMTQLLGDFNDMAMWTWVAKQPRGPQSVTVSLVALLALVAIFVLISMTFVPGGALLGRLFDSLPRRIVAYSVNVAGSVVGIWCFSLTGYLATPPWIWFAFAAILVLPILARPRERWIWLATAVFIVSVNAWLPTPAVLEIWSPYQKLQFSPRNQVLSDGTSVATGFVVGVNGTFFQHAVNLDPKFLMSHPDLWPGQEALDYSSYNLAYRFCATPKRVLVVGSGTGNDVAAALRNGAQSIDAVEIDPEVLDLGRRFHPERPYDNPKVTVYIDDARSFFRKTKKRYDLIVFGTLDSHALTSSFSNIRLDNYVYTVDALREARSLLADHGVMWVVFAVESRFIADRIDRMLDLAFGFQPLTFHHTHFMPYPHAGGGTTFVIDRDNTMRARVASDSRLEGIVSLNRVNLSEGSVEEATDDWPYLYLKDRRIPTLHLLVMSVLVIVVGVFSRPIAGGIRQMPMTYFFLGAGFLLIEVQSISRMALLFGTTWIVNSIVITGVLVMILLANVVATILGPARSVGPLYVGLFGVLLVSSVFPMHRLLAIGPILRGVVSSAVMSAPIFFAGLIFISLFREEARPHAALASNLLGAIVGGFAQSLSFVFGINALGACGMVFYGLAFFFGRQRSPGTNGTVLEESAGDL